MNMQVSLWCRNMDMCIYIVELRYFDHKINAPSIDLPELKSEYYVTRSWFICQIKTSKWDKYQLIGLWRIRLLLMMIHPIQIRINTYSKTPFYSTHLN